MTDAKQTCKVVIVGDGATGKTSLVQTFVEGVFHDDYVPTCYDNTAIDYTVPGSDKTVSLSLWDTAGGEDYDRLRALSFPQTDCFIVAFGVVSPSGFSNVGAKWVPYVRHYMPDTPIVLCGTKRDLRDDPDLLEKLQSVSFCAVLEFLSRATWCG
jgi:Ras-related C3 botulinum toxin substrate 1